MLFKGSEQQNTTHILGRIHVVHTLRHGSLWTHQRTTSQLRKWDQHACECRVSFKMALQNSLRDYIHVWYSMWSYLSLSPCNSCLHFCRHCQLKAKLHKYSFKSYFYYWKLCKIKSWGFTEVIWVHHLGTMTDRIQNTTEFHCNPLHAWKVMDEQVNTVFLSLQPWW